MQHSFLSEVATELYNRYGDEISSLSIVLPTRRARLFFSEALNKVIQRPIWQPEYMSMDDVMATATSLRIGNKMRIISELYKIYKAFHNESFDKFYFWGEVLLADFDLIDKYMIDADMLFRNIYDLKVLEADLSYLTPEMRHIIHTFWSHFAEDAALSEEKREFLAIWLSLAPIYHALHERLTALGIAYQGMIYRSVAENIKSGKSLPDTSRHYVFVGFNALSEGEKRLLNYLTTNGSCDFFWDYDDYYTERTEQEAGRFIRENIREYKPMVDITHDNFHKVSKLLNVVSTPSNIVQCKYLPTILRDISPDMLLDKDTAIVLTDENLLMPLLHSLPQKLQERINVTMGYPLIKSTAYSFTERLMSLQKSARHREQGTTFYHEDVVGILTHPYIVRHEEQAASLLKRIIDGHLIRVEQAFFASSELLATIFCPTEGWEDLAKYLLRVIDKIIASATESGEQQALKASYLAQMSISINEVVNCLVQCDIDISTSTFTTLLRRHLSTIRIPFSGEPLQGLQVMGILETRALDFKNVILLSMTDDNFPGKRGGNSFIPYNLRAAYGMPTPEHHEGVYAYYFYRLVQRAERVDMLYSSHTDEKSSGEQSRYIYQLAYEAPYALHRTNVGVDIEAAEAREITIEKDPSIISRLNEYLSPDSRRYLSPSALTPYINCPLQFYFSTVAKICPTEDIDESVDNKMFGTILHAAMQHLYEGLEGLDNPTDELKRLIEGRRVEEVVEQAISCEFLKDESYKAKDFSGNLMLVKEIVAKYIRNGIIPYDIRHDGFSFVGFEKEIFHSFDLGDGRKVNLGGKADRIDSLKNGNLRVVDYKTGKEHLSFNGLEELFGGKSRNMYNNIVQTMIYSMILAKEQKRNIEPALYYARYMHREEFSPRIRNNQNGLSPEVDYASYAEHFEHELQALLREMFDASIPFRQCPKEDVEVCRLCNFRTICKR